MLAGLVDLCVGSGVISEGSISDVMEGYKYNRVGRLHKIVYDAIFRLAILDTCQPWSRGSSSGRISSRAQISTFHDEVSQTSFTALMDDASRSRMLLLFKEHVDTIVISTPPPLTAFWAYYHDMADITLGLILAAI